LLLASFALASCRPEEKQSLLIAGSKSTNAGLREIKKAFEAKHPVEITLEPGGSTGGVVALRSGAIDIATVDREVTAAEDDVNLRDYLIARDGIAIIVHPQNPLGSLALHQVTDVFAGRVKPWKALAGGGGPAADLDKLGDIVLVDLAKDSENRKSLIDMLFSGDDPVRPTTEVKDFNQMIETVGSEPRAIGFASFHTLHARHKEGSVKVLHVDDVEVTRETMLSGRYPLTRSFYLATYKDPPKIAEEFITFTLGPDGQKLLDAYGLVTVSPPFSTSAAPR
jgi:phosphate transport system substrate-binding protein